MTIAFFREWVPDYPSGGADIVAEIYRHEYTFLDSQMPTPEPKAKRPGTLQQPLRISTTWS